MKLYRCPAIPEVSVRCKKCLKMFPIGSVYGDRDGEPYLAYYCKRCAESYSACIVSRDQPKLEEPDDDADDQALRDYVQSILPWRSNKSISK